MVVSIFGSPWNLKTICVRSNNRYVRKLLVMIYGWYQYGNNSSIAWNSKFSGEPCFPHGMKSIFVSGDAKIGKNCVIFQQVTIGSNTLSDSRSRGAPVIGDNCYIGAGAKIISNAKSGITFELALTQLFFRTFLVTALC